MKALSQSEYGEIRSLYESMYAPKEVITEELIDEIIDELVEELISEGVDEEEAYSLVEEATDTYIDEAKVTFGSDTAPIRKSGAPVGARRRYGMRKAGDALQGVKKAAGSAYKTAKSKAAGAAVDVAVAGSMAKKKAGEVKKAAQEAPGKAKAAVTTAASDAKKKTKSGIKGFIKRQAQKVVSRMSEENEEVEEYIDFLITEGYDCSDLTWNDMYEEYQSLDEGLRSAVKRLLGGKKKEEPAKPMSRGDELRKKYNVGPERSDTSAKAQILKKTRAKAESDQKEFGGSRYSKGVADRSKAAHERQLKGGYSKYGADDARGSGNKARKRAAALTKEELEATGLFTVKEIEALVESENVDEAITSEKGKAALKKEEVEKLDEISQKTATKAFAKRATDEFENDGDYRGDFTKSGKSKANETKRRIEKKHGKKAGQHAERAAHATTFGRKSFSMPKVDEEYVDEAMSSYDRNRKRAAQRAADRNAARAAGKTGVVPGVGYVTPRREKETYTDEKGTVRHKSGAKNEELELDENRRAARAAGGYKDDSKKQTDPSKAGFTGISNSIADIMRQNKEIEARKKK